MMKNDNSTSKDQVETRLDMIMHECYTFLNSLSEVLKELSKIDFRSKADYAKDRVDEANYLMLMLSNILQYWTISQSDRYYEKTSTKDVDLWTPFEKPSPYFRRLIKKNRLRYTPKANEKYIPMIKNAWPILYAVPSILLDNAIKYAPKDTDINCFFDYSTDSLTIRMENDGPYLKESEIQDIFELGVRGENAILSETRGSGYGLSFLKEIIDVHGGSISVESEKKYSINGIFYGPFSCSINIPIE